MKRCMRCLCHALNSLKNAPFSDAIRMANRRYSSTALRFPLVWYSNWLIIKELALRARADCARRRVRVRAQAQAIS